MLRIDINHVIFIFKSLSNIKTSQASVRDSKEDIKMKAGRSLAKAAENVPVCIAPRAISVPFTHKHSFPVLQPKHGPDVQTISGPNAQT